jgi:hypothetical protein
MEPLNEIVPFLPEIVPETDGNSPKNGTQILLVDTTIDTKNKTPISPTPHEAVPFFPWSSTVFPTRSTTFPYKQYQKRDTEPVRNHTEPVKEPKEILSPKFDEFWKVDTNPSGVQQVFN